MKMGGRGKRVQTSAPDSGVSTVEWGAALLLIAAIVAVLAVSDVPTTVGGRTRAAICEIFQGGNCLDEAGLPPDAGEPPGGPGPGGGPVGPGGDPPADSPGGPGTPRDDTRSTAVLTPELLGQFQRCEQAVPAGFVTMMGYTPACVDTPYGRRATDPTGECSAPLLGNSGPGYDFTLPCLTHDFGYDLQRYYQRIGTPHDPDTRRAADRQFREDLSGYCETRGGLAGFSCRGFARVYATAVEWASRLARNGPPR